jgi:putative restriction endonuclease
MKYTATEQDMIRRDIFRWLDERQQAGQYDFSREELGQYTWQGEKINLVNSQGGIWNPVTFDTTLSILTSPRGGNYEDKVEEGGMLVRYAFARAQNGTNVKLREAHRMQNPLIYFRPSDQARKYRYVANYPVYVADVDEVNREFVIAMAEEFRLFADPLESGMDERKWTERLVLARVHQPKFRAMVMSAYAETCAVCHLKHVQLLDAAHIIPDTHELGKAVVPNGLSLCKIHHAAYDSNFLGITPDFEVRINADLLEEVDGPMLKHGLQEMHGRTLHLPQHEMNWPGKENLDFRFEKFAA